jgi:hypothetical protein
VQAHAHPDQDVLWPAVLCQSALDVDYGCHGLGGLGKGGEKGVTLGVNLDPVPSGYGITNDLIVTGDQDCVLVS